MRTRWVWIAVLVWCGACSVPDDPEWGEVQAGIRQLPPPVLVDAKRWAANQNARRYLEIQSNDDLMTVWCKGPSWEGSQGLLWRALDVVRCLDRPEVLTYEECIIRLTSETKSRMEAANEETGLDCRPWFHNGYQSEATRNEPHVEPDWQPRLVTVPEIESDLVQSPVLPPWVPWVVIGGVVVVGGVLTGGAAWLPALCTLQAGSGPACPGNPNYPPGQTPQPDRGSP